MNRLTVPCILLALIAGTGIFAHAQPVATLNAKPSESQPLFVPVIYCAQQAAPAAVARACEVRQPGSVTHPGSNVTRLEIECVLSGKCEVAERGRIHY